MRETTYRLQVSMRDVERMEVFEPLRHIEQLSMAYEKSKGEQPCLSNEKLSYQQWSGCAWMGRYELPDIPVNSPFVNESELEERHIDAAERQDVFVRQFHPHRNPVPQDLQVPVREGLAVLDECTPS